MRAAKQAFSLDTVKINVFLVDRHLLFRPFLLTLDFVYGLIDCLWRDVKHLRVHEAMAAFASLLDESVSQVLTFANSSLFGNDVWLDASGLPDSRSPSFLRFYAT